MASDVFISYATQDCQLAERICAELEAEGFRCWIAPRDVGASTDFAKMIPTVIAETNIFLLLLSAASASSDHVEREIHLASAYSIPILPLRADRTEPSGALRYFLANTQHIDIFPRAETQFPRLRVEVRRLLESRGIRHEERVRVSPFRRAVASVAAWVLVLVLVLALIACLRARWFNLLSTSRMLAVLATDPPALLLISAIPLTALALQFWSSRNLDTILTLDALFAMRASRGAQVRTAVTAALVGLLTALTMASQTPVSVSLEPVRLEEGPSGYARVRPCTVGDNYVRQSNSHYRIRTSIGGGNPPDTYDLNIEISPYATDDGVELCEVWVDRRLSSSVSFIPAMVSSVYVIRITDVFDSTLSGEVVRFNFRHYRDSQPADRTRIRAWLARGEFRSKVAYAIVPKSIWPSD